MKGKYKNRTRVAKGFGPRHALNAQEGSEEIPAASPSELPTPPVQAATPNDYSPSLKKIYPNLLKAFGQAGSELAGMSKEDYAKLAISMLAGGEEMPLGEPGAVPQEIWNSWKVVKKPSPDNGVIRRDEAGNHYEFLGTDVRDSGEPFSEQTRHTIVRPVEAPNAANDYEEQPIPLSVPEEQMLLEKQQPPQDLSKLSGQNWLDAYMKQADEMGLVKPSPQQIQDALDALKQPSAEEPPLPPEEPPFTPNVPRYARGKMSVGPRHADNGFQEGTSDTSGYNPSGFYGYTLEPQDVAQMRQQMDAPGRSSLSPIEETLAQNPDAQSFYFDQSSGNYVPFGGASGYQDGAVAVPEELPTPPDAPETLGGAYIGEAADALKNAIISPKDMAQIRADPTGLQSIPVYARALTTAGTMVGGEGELAASGSIAKKTANLLFKAASMRKAAQNAQENGYARGAMSVGPRHADNGFQGGEDDVGPGHRYRFLTVGERFGEHGRDANYHQGVKLGPHAASVSPNVAKQLGLVIDPTGQNPASHFISDGQAYYAGDPSAGESGPTSNSVEFRDYDHGDGGTITPAPGAYTGDQSSSGDTGGYGGPYGLGSQQFVDTGAGAPSGLGDYLQSYGVQPQDTSGGYTGGIGQDYMTPGGGDAYGGYTGPSGEPLDPSVQIGPDLSQYLSSQDPNSLLAGDITGASLENAQGDQSAQGGDQQGGGDGTFNLGDLPVSNLSAQPPDQSGGSSGGMQLINELGYNPSYAYGSSGSGVPTQNAAGYGGQLVGGILGNLAVPVLGGLIGSQLGKYGGQALARMFQSGPAPGSPAAPQQTQGGSGGGSGSGFGNLFPSDVGGLGQPMGYFPWYDPGNTGSSSYAPFTGGVGGEGGTLAGGSNIGAGPLPGSFAGLGSFGGGDLGSYGGGIGEHTPSFQAWVQGQGFPNVASYQAAMAGPPGPTMAMAGGGGGAPVGLQHATGGHITTAQKGDDEVKGKVAGAGHDFSEDKQLWDKILTATWGVQTPTELLGPVPLKDDLNEESLAAQGGNMAVGPRHADNAHSTDTVPAMLTPREAVLNRNAAELAGRGNIQKLNSEGNQLAEQGVDLAGEDKNMKQKYQRGAARIAPVPLTGPKPTARADLAGIMKYLPMGQLARSAQSQAVMPKVGVRGYQAGTSATDPLSMYQNKLSTSPLGGGQSLGGGPGPSPFPGPSPTPNPGPGPMPVSTTPPPYGGRPVPTLGGAPSVPPRPDAGKDPTGAMSMPLSFNNWAANAGAPGFVTQPVPPQGPSMPPKGSQPSTPPNITIPPLPQSSGAAPPITTRTPPPLPSASFFPPPGPAQRTPPPLGFQGGTIDAPQAGTQFANVQYSAPQINIAALKQHLQSQGIQPNQISGIINQIQQYRASTPAASYGEGSQVSQDLGPALEAGFPGYQGGISDIGYPPMVGPNMVYHADKGSNWIGEFDPRYTFQRYWRGTGAVMPMGAGLGPVMGARPFVHPVRPVPPVRF